MKRLAAVCCCMGLLALSAGLAGCAGSDVGGFPDVATQNSPGSIQGSDFGGHAPIVGAHVFVLQAVAAGTASAGYAAKVQSLLNLTSVATLATYPVLPDLNATSPTFGSYFVTTDANGAFNITGDYACTSGSPVYLYASGGSPNLAAGATVTAATNNPAIVNLAMLGVCPSSGNFSTAPTALRYVYMNEISTAAAAYAMAGFASDALHVGSSSTNATGLQNAAINASNLYDIQGLDAASNSTGQGHNARVKTVAGNGTVPQAELDTLGNILAACVDSGNTAAVASAQCATLFAAATSTGLAGGAKPIDTASAAINIAHHPGTANVVGLYGLPQGTVPFSPNLLSPPVDFTVAITYSVATPGGIAIDASGDAYVATNASAGYVTELSPTGVVLATSAMAGNGFDSIAVDPAGGVWVVANGSNALYAYSSGLAAVTGSPFGSSSTLASPTGVAIDTSGYVYVTDGGNSNSIVQKFTTAGTISASISNSCQVRLSTIALDASAYIWSTVNSSNAVCRVSPTGGSSVNAGGINGPGGVAIDSGGNAWVPAGAQTDLKRYTPSGSVSSFGVVNNANQGGLSSPAWVAIDGGNNVWVTNKGNSYALSEFNSAGVAVTGTSGYQGGVLNSPSFVAIDGSGDVWVPNQGNSTVTELIGVGTPTVTPLSMLKPGVQP